MLVGDCGRGGGGLVGEGGSYVVGEEGGEGEHSLWDGQGWGCLM